jgi:hypothetical protein
VCLAPTKSSLIHCFDFGVVFCVHVAQALTQEISRHSAFRLHPRTLLLLTALQTQTAYFPDYYQIVSQVHMYLNFGFKQGLI